MRQNRNSLLWRTPRALAGTAMAILFGAAQAASAAEIQMRPATISGSEALAGADSLVATSSGPNCLSADLKDASNRLASCLPGERAYAFSLSAERTSDLGRFETYVSIASSGTDLSPDRLLLRRDELLANRGRVILGGIKGNFWDDRVRLTIEMGWSDRRGAEFQPTDWPVIGNHADNETARLVRLEAKLIDAPRLQWSVTGEFSKVSDDFFLGDSVALRPMVALPGRRMAVASTLKWGRTRLSAGLDRYENRFGTFSGGRFAIGLDGFSVRLRENHASFSPAIDSPLLDGRTASRSITLEIEPGSLLRSPAAQHGLIGILLPETVMLNWRTGWSEAHLAASTDRFARRGVEASGTWETPLGETMLGYWDNRRVGAAASLGISRDRQIQLSHVIRRGDWSVGIDAVSSDHSSSRGDGFSDRSISLGGMISYARPNGPQVQIRFGRDQSRSSNDDRSSMSSQRFSSVTASVDLTQFVRRHFGRDDLQLEIDYRRRAESLDVVETFDNAFDLWSDNERRGGLLVSFAMKL